MKKLLNWQVGLGLILILLSASVYFVHYLIFRDLHHIFLYLIGDIAFVFIEVLLVTLVLHQLLNRWERKSLLKKLNMIVGAFYSEVGTELLRAFSACDIEAEKITRTLIVTNSWSEKDFAKICNGIKNHNFVLDTKNADMESIKSFLKDKRQFLLNLLENPNLLEHEDFTNLLWAVFHITEELLHRKDLKQLPESDRQHLTGDVKRVYLLLISEWLEYMKHLKNSYPYLFSLAIRTNPFDPNASITVK